MRGIMRSALSVLGASIFLLCQSCNTYAGKQESVDYFYEQYPFMVSKTQSLSAYVENGFRERTEYYRFSIDEKNLSEFLDRGKYVDVKVLTDSEVNRTTYHLNDQAIEFKCSVNFIKINPAHHHYLSWWDLQSIDDKTCYTQRPLETLRQRKVVYDRSKKILYVYSYLGF
jgi:hypothetical protein